MRGTIHCLTLLLVIGCLAPAAPAGAQLTTASIRGTVTDSTGAVLPGATVTVKGDVTGFTRDTTTNAQGFYSFAELPVGTYTLEVTLSGFKSASRTGIVLNVADVRAEDVRSSPARFPRPSPSSPPRSPSRRSAARSPASSRASRCASCR